CRRSGKPIAPEDRAGSTRPDPDPDHSWRRLYVLAGDQVRLNAILRFLRPHRIGTQIAVMVVASLLISHTITTATFLLLSPPPNFDHPFGTVRARLIVAAQLIAGASTPEQRLGAVEAVHRNFPEVQVVSEPPSPDRLRPEGRLTRGLQHSVGLTFMAFV